MATPYKIQITKAGISTDLFWIRYTVSGDTTLYQASTPCGDVATLITAQQLLSGYVVMLPSNVDTVYVYDLGGTCEGRYTAIYIIPPTPTPTPTTI